MAAARAGGGEGEADEAMAGADDGTEVVSNAGDEGGCRRLLGRRWVDAAAAGTSGEGGGAGEADAATEAQAAAAAEGRQRRSRGGSKGGKEGASSLAISATSWADGGVRRRPGVRLAPLGPSLTPPPNVINKQLRPARTYCTHTSLHYNA